MNKLTRRTLTLLAVLTLGLTTTACGDDEPAPTKVKIVKKTDHGPEKAAKRIEKDNVKRQQKLNQAKADLEKRKADFAKVTKAPAKPAATTDTTTLAQKNYAGEQEITVNDNNPGFTAADLSTANGAWERYADLDSLNRAVSGNALLNQSLMPTEKREPLTWDPTGWRNRRIGSGWLYNRSHLIGFQLSGENNNPKNLMTGTRSLNSPLMLAHENDLAYYLKQSPKHFVRYEVRPVYRGNELVARGVQLRAQSVGDNQIHFNVYIFNVEDGVTINYADGTSRLTQ